MGRYFDAKSRGVRSFWRRGLIEKIPTKGGYLIREPSAGGRTTMHLLSTGPRRIFRRKPKHLDRHGKKVKRAQMRREAR